MHAAPSHSTCNSKQASSSSMCWHPPSQHGSELAGACSPPCAPGRGRSFRFGPYLFALLCRCPVSFKRLFGGGAWQMCHPVQPALACRRRHLLYALPLVWQQGVQRVCVWTCVCACTRVQAHRAHPPPSALQSALAALAAPQMASKCYVDAQPRGGAPQSGARRAPPPRALLLTGPHIARLRALRQLITAITKPSRHARPQRAAAASAAASRLLAATQRCSTSPALPARCTSCAMATPAAGSGAICAAASATPAFRFSASATGPAGAARAVARVWPCVAVCARVSPCVPVWPCATLPPCEAHGGATQVQRAGLHGACEHGRSPFCAPPAAPCTHRARHQTRP